MLKQIVPQRDCQVYVDRCFVLPIQRWVQIRDIAVYAYKSLQLVRVSSFLRTIHRLCKILAICGFKKQRGHMPRWQIHVCILTKRFGNFLHTTTERDQDYFGPNYMKTVEMKTKNLFQYKRRRSISRTSAINAPSSWTKSSRHSYLPWMLVHDVAQPKKFDCVLESKHKIGGTIRLPLDLLVEFAYIRDKARYLCCF